MRRFTAAYRSPRSIAARSAAACRARELFEAPEVRERMDREEAHRERLPRRAPRTAPTSVRSASSHSVERSSKQPDEVVRHAPTSRATSAIAKGSPTSRRDAARLGVERLRAAPTPGPAARSRGTDLDRERARDARTARRRGATTRMFRAWKSWPQMRVDERERRARPRSRRRSRVSSRAGDVARVDAGGSRGRGARGRGARSTSATSARQRRSAGASCRSTRARPGSRSSPSSKWPLRRSWSAARRRRSSASAAFAPTAASR